MSKARDLANFISTGALTDGSLDIADVDGLQAAIDDKLDTDGDGSSLTGVDSLPSQSGNADKFLTTNGSAASWGEAGGGAWEFISTATASNVSSVVFSSGLSGYSYFVLIGHGFRPSANAQILAMRLNEVTSGYTGQSVVHASSSVANGASQTDYVAIGNEVSNNSSDAKSNSVIAYIFGAESSTKQVTATVNYKHENGGVRTGTSGYGLYNTDDLDHIEVYFTGGNIYGTFHLYGVKA